MDGNCVLRYDNEAGKGDHKHIGDDERTNWGLTSFCTSFLFLLFLFLLFFFFKNIGQSDLVFLAICKPRFTAKAYESLVGE